MGKSSKIVTCADCGLERLHMGRGFCNNCYHRALRRGFAPIPPKVVPSFVGDPRLPDRFWLKVRIAENGCWHWTGFAPEGYGRYQAEGKSWPAHRYLFHTLVEPLTVPRGQQGHLEVDHQCHNQDEICPGGPTCQHRRCVNPAHLRAVPARTNTLAGKAIPAMNARATHCSRGHELSGENLVQREHGKRGCRTCGRKRSIEYLVRKLGRPRQTPPHLRTHCPQGHPLSGDNLYVPPGVNARHCRTCKNERKRRNRLKAS